MVQMPVQIEHQGVGVVAQIGQPFGVLNHPVKMVAMDHPQAATIDGGVHGFLVDFDTAKGMVKKLPGKFVVVARHINHLAAFAGSAQ